MIKDFKIKLSGGVRIEGTMDSFFLDMLEKEMNKKDREISFSVAAGSIEIHFLPSDIVEFAVAEITEKTFVRLEKIEGNQNEN